MSAYPGGTYYPEGYIYEDVNTGNRYEMSGGQWVLLSSMTAQPGPPGPEGPAGPPGPPGQDGQDAETDPGNLLYLYMIGQV